MLIWIMVILSNLFFILNIIDFFVDNVELIILVMGGMILFIFPYADFWKFLTGLDNEDSEENDEKNKRSVYYYNNESKDD